MEANQCTDREDCKNRKLGELPCRIGTKLWGTEKGPMKKKGGISAPEIIRKLSSALCSERRLLPFEFGNNFGQGLTIPIHGVFHGII